jgi:signal transduction histidine kinase
VLQTDAERLRLALVNLIVNARQAVAAQRDERAPRGPAGSGDEGTTAQGPPGPPVDVSVSASDDRVTITVSDRGPGIEPDDLPRIFDPYFSTKRGGTGLGLPIAKNIVDGLGGTITVVSTTGRGTEINIELPRSAGAGTGV